MREVGRWFGEKSRCTTTSKTLHGERWSLDMEGDAVGGKVVLVERRQGKGSSREKLSNNFFCIVNQRLKKSDLNTISFL